MKKDAKNWVQIAKYDLETAKAMMNSSRFLYVLFTCQQAVEKMLKALIVEFTKKLTKAWLVNILKKQRRL